MFLYYILMIDFAAISTRISAFALVCIRMLNEVSLFLGALSSVVLAFSSATSVVKHDSDNFAGIHKGIYTLTRIFLGMLDTNRFKAFRKEPVVLALVFLFFLLTVVFLINLFIAQICCAYSSIYEDMLGYARLERAEIIVEIMPSVPKVRWADFVDDLRLHKRLEFNEGDVGLAGGIQVLEAASANPTTVDIIRRFGGSTSIEMQWPIEMEINDEDDRFEKMEKLIHKTLKRITGSGAAEKSINGKGEAATGSGSRSRSEGSDESDPSGAEQQ
jgi:hypothetical protein